MTVLENCRERMNTALKNGNKQERAVYSSIVNALNSKAKEMKVATLSTDEEIAVVTKLSKQNQESIRTCPTGRKDILQNLEYEKEIITSFLPKQMNEEEINEVINSVLANLGIKNPSMKDKGKIMKVLMPLVKGKADGKLVNELLSKYF